MKPMLAEYDATVATTSINGKYTKKRDGVEYSYESTWLVKDNGASIGWYARVRCKGKLAGTPGGSFVYVQGTDVAKTVRDLVETSIEDGFEDKDKRAGAA
jgi:hypothetical protein